MRLTVCFRPPAIRISAFLIAAAAAAQAQQIPSDLSLPDATITSGSATYEATNSISAVGGFSVGGTASVTFQAGGTIILGLGFTAIGAGTQPSFTALIATPSAANFTLALPATATVTLGQSVTLQGTITPVAGFNTPVTPSIPGSPGVSASFSPAAISMNGTNPVTFSMTINTGTGATASSTPVNVLVTAEGAPTEWTTVALTINPPPVLPPVLSLMQPTPGTLTNPTSVWGATPLQGYALEPTPFLPAEAISGVNVSIVQNDDQSNTITGGATYGPALGPQYDACGGNGVTGAYPGSPGCPYVGFSYSWTTGLNAIYTATLSASDNSAPPVSNSISSVFSVDNQTPSPEILSPVNGSGLLGHEQIFTFVYTSPHSNLDFGYGQIWFVGTALNYEGYYPACGIQWNLSPPSAQFLWTSSPSVCQLVDSDTVITSNGTNQVTVQVGVIFYSAMAQGTPLLSIDTFATNSLGQLGGDDVLTNFTLNSPIAPAILTSQGSNPSYIIATSTSSGYAGSACYSFAGVWGAEPPFSVYGSPSVTYTSGSQTPPQLSLQFLSSSVTSPLPCPAGSLLVQATYPSGTASGTAYQVAYVVIGSSGSTTITNLIVASSTPQFSVTVPSSSVTVSAGTSVTVPITVSSLQGFSGVVNLTTNGATLDAGNVQVSPTSAATVHLTFTADPSAMAGTYLVSIVGTGPSGTYAQSTGLLMTVTGAAPPDFTISSIEPVSISAGQSLNFSAVITPIGGFNGAVTLNGISPADAPGISVPSSVSTVTGAQTFTGTIISAPTAVSCTYLLPVLATSGNVQHTSWVSTTVVGGSPPFATPFMSNGAIVIAGSSTTLAITATATSCFNATPSFSYSGFPSGISVTFPSNPPPLTGWAFASSPALLANVVVSASSTVPVNQSYSGGVTVGFSDGSSYRLPLTITVYAPTPPSYNLLCSPTSVTLVPGGLGQTVTINLQPLNGYSYTAYLLTGSLPSGVNVSFDNGRALSSGGWTASASISALASSPAGTYQILIGSSDGVTGTKSCQVSVTVRGPPLSVISSVTDSVVDMQAPHLPQRVAVTAMVSGGVLPYSYTITDTASGNLIYPSLAPGYLVSPPATLGFGMATAAMDRHFLLTVTDSSPMPQTVTKHILVPAAQAYPDSMMQHALLNRISQVESLATTLQSVGADPSGVRNLLMTRLGINAQQYGQLVPLAAGLQSAHALNAAAYRNAINSLSSNGVTVATASTAQLAPLASVAAAEAELPANYTAQIQRTLASAYADFDNNGWSLLGEFLSDCDPTDGCGTCDYLYDSCGDVLPYLYFAATGLVIDNPTGLYDAATVEVLQTPYGFVSDQGLCVSVSMMGPLATTLATSPSNCGLNDAASAIAELQGQAAMGGYYTATGTTAPMYGCLLTQSGQCGGGILLPSIATQNTANLTLTACAPPTINTITVDSGSGPQLISELPIGSSGKITVYGACLDGTSQLSIGFDPSSDYAGNASGVTLSNISAPGWGVVTASYSVASGTMPETVVLTVTTSGGSAGANMDVVSAGPYIEYISPVTWLPGTTTNVTISGSGFGTNPGSLTVTAPNGDVSLINIQSWSDNMIVMNVSTGPNSTGETVTISVTGGIDFGLATGFQQQNGPSTGRIVSGTAFVTSNACFNSEVSLMVDQYQALNVTPVPTCTDFTQSSPSTFFLFPTLVSPKDQFPDWAILTGYLGANIDSIYLFAPYQMKITSGYRDPVANSQTPGSAKKTSRHMFGDGVDIATYNEQSDFDNMRSTAKTYGAEQGHLPCFELQRDSSLDHLHVDWRPRALCPSNMQ